MDGQVTDRSSIASNLRAYGLLLVLAASGCGDVREVRHHEAFQSADIDKDGLVSQTEFAVSHPEFSVEVRERDFLKADRDADRQLDFDEFEDTIRAKHRVLWALGIFSAISFVGSLIAIPVVVARLPVDHFVAPHEAADWVASDARRRGWLVLKNLLGVLLIIGGLMMLVLPGQGVLTVLLGVALTDFPGKWKLMRALARRPNVMKALNWMRERAKQPPLMAPQKGDTQREIPLVS